MENTVVIYHTKYGSTRQYARWIAEDLNCETLEDKTVTAQDLESYDTVIYGGPIYAGGVSGIKLIRNHFEVLRTKHLIVFTCGLSDPNNPENVRHIREGLAKTLTAEMLQHLVLFQLRGAIDYSKLNMLHRAMMAMWVRPLKKKDPAALTAEEHHMLSTYGKAVTFMDRSAIAPIVQAVRAG